MHTTASDGLLTPAELVSRAVAAGLTTISVTDHDTVAALAEVRRHAGSAGLALVTGIEITSVHNERDVHMLGYFIRDSDPDLARFLSAQRAQRVDRVREIAAKLARLGLAVDVEPLIEAAARTQGASIGRPAIARAMVDAGLVDSVQAAFDRFLATGQPAFVPRKGATPAEVVAVIHAAGGVASLAHPGLTKQPEIMEPLAAEGLDAIEVYHADHTAEMQQDALATSKRLHLLVSGGSDYHGDDERRPIGCVTLPQLDFAKLAAHARR